jgi:hypothetical protein
LKVFGGLLNPIAAFNEPQKRLERIWVTLHPKKITVSAYQPIKV